MPAKPAGKSTGELAKNFRLVNLKLIQDKLKAGHTLSRAEVKTLREFEEEAAESEAVDAMLAPPANMPAKVGNKRQAVTLCRVTEAQFDAAAAGSSESLKAANGQWIMAVCWRATMDARAGKSPDKASVEDFAALKAKEEYERVRDGNLIRRGQLMSKEEQLALIAAGFAPIRNYLETGVNALAEKVADRPQAKCQEEIRKFFLTILKQIASGDFPAEIVETLLDDLKRSALSTQQAGH